MAKKASDTRKKSVPKSVSQAVGTKPAGSTRRKKPPSAVKSAGPPSRKDEELDEMDEEMMELEMETDDEEEALALLLGDSEVSENSETEEDEDDDDLEPDRPMEKLTPSTQLAEDEMGGFETEPEIDLEEELGEELGEDDRVDENEVDSSSENGTRTANHSDHKDDSDHMDDDDISSPQTKEKRTNKKIKAAAPAAETAEWTCPSCFLNVQPRQFGSPQDPICPSGETVCPGMKKFF